MDQTLVIRSMGVGMRDMKLRATRLWYTRLITVTGRGRLIQILLTSNAHKLFLNIT